jgi:hypothetical protein
MDIAAAEERTRELVDGLTERLGLEPAGELVDERVPCRRDEVESSYEVRGPTPSGDVLDEAVRWLEDRGLAVDDRRPEVTQLGTVDDGIVLQVTVSRDGSQLSIAATTGCRTAP